MKENKLTPTGISKGQGRYPVSSMRGNLGADQCLRTAGASAYSQYGWSL